MNKEIRRNKQRHRIMNYMHAQHLCRIHIWDLPMARLGELTIQLDNKFWIYLNCTKESCHIFAFAPKIEVLSVFIEQISSKERRRRKSNNDEAKPFVFPYKSSENVNNIIQVFAHVRVVYDIFLLPHRSPLLSCFHNDSFIVVNLFFFMNKTIILNWNTHKHKHKCATHTRNIHTWSAWHWCVCMCKWARK